jgi:hypothetical protein
MARPSTLTYEIQQRIGDNVALGLPYVLAAASAGITYQTFNDWIKKGKKSKSGEYFQFYKHINKCNANGALKILQRLNDADEVGKCQFCMWILKRRFPDDMEGTNIGKLIQFQRIKTRTLR